MRGNQTKPNGSIILTSSAAQIRCWGRAAHGENGWLLLHANMFVSGRGLSATLLTGDSTGTEPPRGFWMWHLVPYLDSFNTGQIESKREDNFLSSETISNIPNYLLIIVDIRLRHVCERWLDIVLHILFPSFPVCFQGIISAFHFVFKFSYLFCKLNWITKKEKLMYVFLSLSEIIESKLNIVSKTV